ncbi:MAG: GNAT family N-acetyltransferase [Woeseiaceae bacterium]|nr:GNAT family N-acetyltransferase [Woeseiaceae bacterium]
MSFRHDSRMIDIAIAEFPPDQLSALAGWLEADHVRRWFPDPDDVTSWAQDVPENGRQRIILEGDRAIGYLRWTYVPREILDAVGFDDIPADSADIDLLIGPREGIGRGIGRRALELAVAEIQAEGIAHLAALTTSVDNHGAHRAFAGAGFRIDREYVPEGFGRCYLMVRDL